MRSMLQINLHLAAELLVLQLGVTMNSPSPWAVAAIQPVTEPISAAWWSGETDMHAQQNDPSGLRQAETSSKRA